MDDRFFAPTRMRWMLLACSSLVLGAGFPAVAETPPFPTGEATSDTISDGKLTPIDSVFVLNSTAFQGIPPKEFVALALSPFHASSRAAIAPAPMEISELVAGTAIAQQVETTDQDSNTRWEIQAEALFLDRDIPDVTTTIDRASNEEYGTDNLSFDLDTGIRWTIGYHVTPADSLELAGFGLINHEDGDRFTSSVLSPGGEVLQAAFEPDLFDPTASNFAQAFRHTIHYSAETTNLELNYRRTLPRSSGGWQGSLLAGVRYLNLSEDFQLTSADEDPAIFPTTSVGRYAIDADNNAIGLQVGGDLSYRFTEDFDIGLRLRTGLLLNSGNQDSEIRNDPGGQTIITRGEGSDTEISPVVELGAFLNWALNRQISLNAGYSFLWFGNMVLAPEQFASSSNFSDSLSGIDRGSVIYHGPSLGIQIRF